MRWLVVVLVCAGCEQLIGIVDPQTAGDGRPPNDGSGSGTVIDGGGTPFDAAMPPDAFGACSINTLTFGAATSYPVTGAETFDLADLDGDGKLDLVVATQTDTVYLINDGSGHFASNRKLVVGEDSAADGVVLADLNNDGRPDVIRWSNDSPTLSIDLHDAATSASFSGAPGTTLNQLGNVQAAFGSALNPAFFAVATSLNKTVILTSNGTGTLSPGAVFTANVAGFGDVDGDGTDDMLFAPALGVSFVTPTIVSLDGMGATLSEGFRAGDSKDAVVSIDLAGDVVVHRQTAPRMFAAGGLAFSPLRPAPGKLQVIDVDGDGRKDVVGLGQVLLSCMAPAPLGQLATSATALPALPGGAAVFQRLIDVDGNGHPDLIAVDGVGGNIVVFLQ